MNKNIITHNPVSALPAYLRDLEKPHVCACPCGQRFERAEADSRCSWHYMTFFVAGHWGQPIKGNAPEIAREINACTEHGYELDRIEPVVTPSNVGNPTRVDYLVVMKRWFEGQS